MLVKFITDEGIMIKRKSTAFKVLVTIFLVAIITTTLATGTLAAFSATYIWQSNQGTIGTFDYTDTTSQINLFDNAQIFPADSGSAQLIGENFSDHTLSWGFAQTNTSNIPLLFYVDNGMNFCGFYSCYDYATEFPDLYIKLNDTTYLSCAEISTQPSNLAQNFAVGFSVYWIWADKLFALAGETYTEVADSIAVNEFLENNENICKSIKTYTYNDLQVLPLLSSSKAKFSYIATSVSENVFTVADFVGAEISVSNGLLMNGQSYLNLYSAKNDSFITPDGNYILSNGDYYLLCSKALTVNHLKSALAETTLNCEVVGSGGETEFVPYFVDETNYEMYASVAEPQRAIVKLYPCELSHAPTISVVITAEVTI